MRSDKNLLEAKRAVYSCIYTGLLLRNTSLRDIAKTTKIVFDNNPDNDDAKDAALEEIAAEMAKWGFPVEFRTETFDLRFQVEKSILDITPNGYIKDFYTEQGCRIGCISEALKKIAEI